MCYSVLYFPQIINSNYYYYFNFYNNYNFKYIYEYRNNHILLKLYF